MFLFQFTEYIDYLDSDSQILSMDNAFCILLFIVTQNVFHW